MKMGRYIVLGHIAYKFTVCLSCQHADCREAGDGRLAGWGAAGRGSSSSSHDQDFCAATRRGPPSAATQHATLSPPSRTAIPSAGGRDLGQENIVFVLVRSSRGAAFRRSTCVFHITEGKSGPQSPGAGPRDTWRGQTSKLECASLF